MTERCIWCGKTTTDGDVEHIIPEAIGCPPQFVLTGSVVCRGCNTGLAPLDRAVADEFDLLSFMAGMPRKHGKPPLVSSRGNVLASYLDGKPTLTFNMEQHAVRAHDGSRLAPFGASPRNIQAKFSRCGPQVEVSASVPFGQSPKFVRGLTKIALSSVAYFLGAEVARASTFDHVREYVIEGVGVRHVLVQASGDAKYRNTVWAPYRGEQGQLAVTFRLAQLEFLIDLSSGETLLPQIEAKLLEQMGKNGWCVIPLRG